MNQQQQPGGRQERMLWPDEEAQLHGNFGTLAPGRYRVLRPVGQLDVEIPFMPQVEIQRVGYLHINQNGGHVGVRYPEQAKVEAVELVNLGFSYRRVAGMISPHCSSGTVRRWHQEAVADGHQRHPFGAYTVILIYCLIVSFILNVAYLVITKFASLLF